MKYCAVCNMYGPISVLLEADTLEDAIQEFEAADKNEWINNPRKDAEDDLDINGEGMSENEFEDALIEAGCSPVQDLEPIVNSLAGTVAHLADGWYLWGLPECVVPQY